MKATDSQTANATDAAVRQHLDSLKRRLTPHLTPAEYEKLNAWIENPRLVARVRQAITERINDAK